MTSLPCHVLFVLIWVTCAACMGGDEDRFEQIKKLRSLGVTANPVISQPSVSNGSPSVTLLTVYAALPLGQEVMAEPYMESQSGGLSPLSVEIIAGTEQYKDYAGFRVYSVNARVEIPPVQRIPIPPKPGYARLKYGVRLRSGEEEEKIVGNLLIYPQGAPELSWQAPSAAVIVSTEGGALEGTIPLKANLVSHNQGENLRVGWYVSSGKVQNRRAQETVWEEAESGAQTVVMTVRGLKSGAFAPPTIVDVQVP